MRGPLTTILHVQPCIASRGTEFLQQIRLSRGLALVSTREITLKIKQFMQLSNWDDIKDMSNVKNVFKCFAEFRP